MRAAGRVRGRASRLGAGALPRLLEQIREREEQMTGLARRLFAAWLEHVVGLERRDALDVA